MKPAQHRVKPRLRGVSHAIGAVAAIPATVLCIAHASAGGGTVAAAIYCASVLFLLATSATYHMPNWNPRARMWLRRVDHTAIFVLIAGTYTPLCLIGLPSGGTSLLIIVWAVAAAGALQSMLWPTAPRWATVPIYLIMGWLLVFYAPEFFARVGTLSIALTVAGGLLYSIGALAYARRWPDPFPRTFGYHEIFHAFVLAAVGCHFVVIWKLVAPVAHG